MKKVDLDELLELLPFSLREPIGGYASSIEDAAQEIFRDAGIKYNKELAGELVFLAGLKRRWTFVDSQFWVLDNSLSLLRKKGVSSVSLGSTSYEYSSKTYQETQKLRDKLHSLLKELGLIEILKATNIKDLLFLLRRGRSYGR